MWKPLDDNLSSPWVLRRSSPVLSGESDSRRTISPDAPADGITRRPVLRARPPFTRPWPLFLQRVCRAYSRPVVAYRFLQLRLRRAGNQTRALHDPRRDGDLDLLPFLQRVTPSPLRKRWRVASRATSSGEDPSVGSSRFRELAQPWCLRRCLTSEVTQGA